MTTIPEIVMTFIAVIAAVLVLVWFCTKVHEAGEEPKTYKAFWRCDNCWSTNGEQIPRGTPSKGIECECGNCGCKQKL